MADAAGACAGSNCYSRGSGPHNGTRRGLTLALRIGPVSSHAASTRPPQAPVRRLDPVTVIVTDQGRADEFRSCEARESLL